MSESEHSEMSYAEVAASGAHQSPEEARANPVPEVIPTDQSVESLIDVNTGVAVVPNDFKEQEVKTETQAARIEREKRAAAEAAEAAAKAKKEKAHKEAAEKSLASNPIVQGNAMLLVILSTALGVGAYRKAQQGQLTWKLVGISVAGVAAVLGADFAVSKWLYQRFPFARKGARQE